MRKLGQFILSPMSLFAAIAAGAMAFAPFAARADGKVRSDFAFQMKQSIFEAPEFDLTGQMTGEQDFSLPDTVFRDEAPVNVSGITGHVNYRLRAGSSKVVLGAEQWILSDQLNATITIRQVSVDAVVERVVAGVLLRMRVQGSCSNIPIQLKAGNQARMIGMMYVGIGTDGLPVVNMPWVTVDGLTDAWQIGDFACTGFDGFKEKVQAGLKAYLTTAASFVPGLQTVFDQKTASTQANLRSWFLSPRAFDTGVNGLKATLYPRQIANVTGSGFQLIGDLEFLFPSATVTASSSVASQYMPPILADWSVAVPESLVEALNAMAYQTGFDNTRLEGQKIPAFKDFLGSSFQKAAAWPELNRYDSTVAILFDATPVEKPQTGAVVDNGNGTLNVPVSGSVSVLTWIPVDSKNSYQKMVTFQSPVSGSAKLSVPAAGGEIKVVFSTLSLAFTSKWDSDYLKICQNTSIDTASLQGAISDSLKTDGFSVKFGAMALSSKVSLTVSSLAKLPAAQGGNLLIQFK